MENIIESNKANSWKSSTATDDETDLCQDLHRIAIDTPNQRDQINALTAEFIETKNAQKVEWSNFIWAKIEYVESIDKFFAIKAFQKDLRQNFQNVMNHSYERYEQFKDVKINDICGVLRDDDNLRGQIIGILANSERYEVFMIDYGHTIIVEKSKIHLLKFEHVIIEPFIIECQLSIINACVEDFSDSKKEKLLQKFKQMVEDTDTFLIFFNGLVPGEFDKYDVVLFADNQTSNTHILHESYAAFNHTQIEFDNDYCKEWFDRLVLEKNGFEIDSQFGKKTLVEIVHIESAMELYVRSMKHQNLMTEIRQRINSFARSEKTQTSSNWSPGKYCLCIMQNPLVDSKMMLWYRARILTKNKIAHSYDVFICDYGYKVQMDESSLIPIPKELEDLEDAVQFCALDIFNIVSIDSDTAMTQLRDLIKRYSHLAVSFSEYTAVVTLWGSNSSAEVGWNDQWDDLNIKFMSQLMKKSMQTFIDKKQHFYVTTKYGNEYPGEDHFNECQKLLMEDIGSCISTSKDQNKAEKRSSSVQLPLKTIDRWRLPDLPDRTEVFGIVTHLHKTGIIFAQIGRDSERATALELSITQYVETATQRCARRHVWKKGSTCLVKPFQGKYYRRAIIKSIDHERGSCKIMFVDYGHKMMAQLNDLYAATCFHEIEMLAKRFYVPEIIAFNSNKEWSPHALQQCRTWLVDKRCKIQIKGNLKTPTKIRPCSIISYEFNQNLIDLIQNNNLYIEEKQNAQGTVYLV